MKIIEVIADEGHRDTITSIAEQHNVEDIWYGIPGDDGRVAIRILTSPTQRQTVLDSLQTLLGTSGDSRIMVIPLEVVLPRASDEPVDDSKPASSAAVSREEIYQKVEKGTKLNSNFILLVILSGIVASIGLLENNIAVIVGAMVIAPLLGPNIAFSLGTTLGDKELLWSATKSIFTGIILAVITGFAIGVIWPYEFNSPELLSRTEAEYSGTAIALASGAAASLSLIAGTSGVLVGVMVAVALIPPAVTIGLMSSIGGYEGALGATLILAINIVCINLSAKLVFLFKGIGPRTWLEASKVKQSRTLYLLGWTILLALLVLMIYLSSR